MQQAANPLERLSGLALLDGREVQGSRVLPLFRAIHGIWDACPIEDRIILTPLASFISECADDLAAARAKSGASSPNIPDGSYLEAPVATTLLIFDQRVQPPGLSRLMAILLAATLEAGPQSGKRRKQIESLASILRGSLKDDGSALRLLLHEVRSIPSMVRSVEQRLRAKREDQVIHLGFESEWKRWLRDTLTRWIQSDPESLAAATEPKFVPDLSASTVPVATGGGIDPDDAPNVSIYFTEVASSAADPKRGTAERKLAEAKSFLRASQGDLSSPPDQFAPVELVSRLARAALASACQSVRQGFPHEAEAAAALALALATGVREIDLGSIVWGGIDSAESLVLDRDCPILHRTVFPPPNAAKRNPEIESCLAPITNCIAWPIPTALHDVLKSLRADAPLPGTPVLPLRSGNVKRRYRLWDVSNEMLPEIGLGATQVRLALAAELTRRFGPEVAQLVLADTFSQSLAPAYYTATLESTVAGAIAEIQEQWFGVPSLLPPDRGLSFGSQMVLTDAAAKTWSTLLRQQRRKKSLSELEAWIAHRDYLAAAFCAATGARPVDEIGRIDLDQLIPEFGLVILRDKAVDSLRLTRVAATGLLWVSELRQFLDRLIRLSSGGVEEAASDLARRILESESPLFSVPSDSGGERALTAAELRQLMPEPLRSVRNIYRHRLNQTLQRAGLDHELRHGQLGWVVSPAHTFANLSHWSAKAFGATMAKALDDVLIQDGWFSASQRTPKWTWRGVPERAPRDWAAVMKAHTDEHKENTRALKKSLREEWQAVLPKVTARLASAVSEFFPSLRLNTTNSQLERVSGFAGDQPIEISAQHHELLCNRVRLDDERPDDTIEALAARIILYRAIRRAKQRGIIKGPTPGRPFFGATDELSPFPPGLGLVIRHAESVRKALLDRAAEQRTHDQGPLTWLSVIAYSPYRSLEQASAAVGAAASVIRADQREDCVRIAATVDRQITPMVFGGLASLLLARRGKESPKARAPACTQVEQWIQSKLECPFELATADSGGLLGVVELFRAAGRIELSGQERTIMLGLAPLAAVHPERSIARDDQWPIHTAPSNERLAPQEADSAFEEEGLTPPESHTPSTVPKVSRDQYLKLTQLLTPEGLSKVLGGKSDGHYGWRSKLDKKLTALREEVGENTNVGLLIGFVCHRLRFGGARVGVLEHATLSGDVTRFAADWLDIAGQSSVIDWDEHQFRLCYLAVVVGKTMGAKRQAFDALVVFHEYLVQVYGVPEVAFSELESHAGKRMTFLSPGMLTQLEIAQVMKVLYADLERERAKTDASPDLVRCLEMRVLLFLVLEGSGIRPASAYGLTLGDVVLFASGKDFVRVRTTGEYGRAKTSSSAGFIPLQGSLWSTHRHWVIRWLDREKGRLDGLSWWKFPLFAVDAGRRRRFRRGYLTHRFDQLIKWVSSDPKGRTYWLRKNRVTARHECASDLERPMARDVYSALCSSGHADIDTAIASYISDPAIVMSASIREGITVARTAILQVTGMDGPQIDMAWMRNDGAQSKKRLSTVLSRIGLEPTIPLPEVITEPPQLGHATSLLPAHVDAYARAMARFGDQREAVLRSGITGRQAASLNEWNRSMQLRKGMAPWMVGELRHKSAVMAPPRRLEGTERLFTLLNRKPADVLCILADTWIHQAHLDRLFANEQGVLIQLSTQEQLKAAHSILAETEINLVVEKLDGAYVLRMPDRTDKSLGHAAAFRWVLAIVWILVQQTNSSPSIK